MKYKITTKPGVVRFQRDGIVFTPGGVVLEGSEITDGIKREIELGMLIKTRARKEESQPEPEPVVNPEPVVEEVEPGVDLSEDLINPEPEAQSETKDE